MSFKFAQITVEPEVFYSTYEVQDINILNIDKILVSSPIIRNKADQRFLIGYETEPGRIIPLYIKTPENCFSIEVSRFNKNPPYNIGFTVSEDWVVRYRNIWVYIENLIDQCLSKNPFKDGKFINPKLLGADGK